MNKLLAAMAVLVLATGCSSAQRASEVSSAQVSVAPYLKMTCGELAQEYTSLDRLSDALADSVDKARSSDKTKEAVAWLIFAPAALLMDGNQEEASKLSAVKGQLQAVQQAQSINGCYN